MRLGIHIIFWLGYLLFETYVEFAWISTSFKEIGPFKRWMMAFWCETSLLITRIPLSYFIIYLINYLAPRFKKPALSIFVGITAIAMATILHRVIIVKFILPYLYHEPEGSQAVFELKRLISSLLDLIFIAGLAVALKQYRLAQKVKENEKKLTREKLEAELKFLRTQTNPHFLFNTLNNIYALARKKSDETPGVVMKLSKLLRFMLYESRNHTIPVADELRVLNDYIELERIRYNERLTIRFTRSIDNETQPIAPLILLPFVENAFKHGASETRFSSFIHIHVQLQDGELIFTIENSKDEQPEKIIEDNIGLANVKRQLELMYPDHSLEILNDKNIFKVSLFVNLSNYATVSMPHR